MLRITVDKKRAEISIQRTIDPIRWDSNANRMKGNKEDARETNSLIDNMILKLNLIHAGLVEKNETVSATKIKETLCGKNRPNKTLLEVFAIHNEMMSTRVGIVFKINLYKIFDHL